MAHDVGKGERAAGTAPQAQRRPGERRQHPRRRAHPWPVGNTPLVAGVQPLGFAPVTEEALQAMVHRLVTGLHPHMIVLFGSYSYGTPTADSDVDLLVIMDTTARPVERYLRVSRLLRPRPFPLDLLVKTPEEIAQALAREDAFMHEITTRGRVLYERTDCGACLGTPSGRRLATGPLGSPTEGPLALWNDFPCAAMCGEVPQGGLILPSTHL